MRPLHIVAPALAVSAAFAEASFAQGYPSRTVSVIVPSPPAGSVDDVARMLVQARTSAT